MPIYRPFFNREKSGIRPKVSLVKEEIEGIELRIAESPPESRGDFKALTLNGVTLSFDASEVHIVYGGMGPGDQSITYVSVMGNLIVLYDRKEDLNGFWFAAETIQKIRMKNPQNSE